MPMTTAGNGRFPNKKGTATPCWNKIRCNRIKHLFRRGQSFGDLQIWKAVSADESVAKRLFADPLDGNKISFNLSLNRTTELKVYQNIHILPDISPSNADGRPIPSYPGDRNPFIFSPPSPRCLSHEQIETCVSSNLPHTYVVFSTFMVRSLLFLYRSYCETHAPTIAIQWEHEARVETQVFPTSLGLYSFCFKVNVFVAAGVYPAVGFCMKRTCTLRSA